MTRKYKKRAVKPVEERLMAKVVKDEATGCWNWTGCRMTQGYGTIGVGRGSMKAAHRLMYELKRGAIPAGLEIDHLCRNRVCINPDHLEAVTHRVNVQRGDGAKPRVPKTHCRRGHELTPENTIYKGGLRRCKTCLRKYEAEYDRKRRGKQ